jgi:DegV family protein with EDD domain
MIAETGATTWDEAGGGRREAGEALQPLPASSLGVVTDSTADLDPAVVEATAITVVPVAIGLGASAFPALGKMPGYDEREPGPRVVDGGARLPSSIEAFAAAFDALLSRHDAIVAVLLSARLGDSVAAARQARDRLPGPERVAIVDSRSVSVGLGLQALRAAALARSGVSLDGAVGALAAARDRYHVLFSIESAEHLRRGGQIGRSTAIIAEMLQLKPLLRIDEGQIVPYERARTRVGAIAELAAFVEQLPAVERVVVLYASDPEDAGRLAKTVAAGNRVSPQAIAIARIGGQIVAHVGPGALGVVVVEGEE